MAAATTLVPPAKGEEAATFSSAVEVNVVNLDVTVRDQDGRPVSGLGPQDFRVLRDGVEVPLSNFWFSGEGCEPEALRPSPPSSSTLDQLSTVQPTVETGVRPAWLVLHIDNENILPIARKRALRQVRQFIDGSMSGSVQMAVVSSRRSLEVRQAFTDDRAAIHAAIDRVSRESSGRLPRDRQRQMILERMERWASDKVPGTDQVQLDIDDEIVKIQVQAQILAFAEEESDVVTDALTNLSETVSLLAGLEGHRSVIFVSSGLSMNPGVELMYEFSDIFRDNTIFADLFGRERADDYRALASWANGHGVRIYTLDATGLMPPAGFGAEDRFVAQSRSIWSGERDLQGSLTYMAQATGGVAVFNTNDVTAGLETIREDISSVYSLGFTVASVQRNKAHRIRVELPEHPDYEVRHRRWIINKTEETRILDRLGSALIRGGADNPFELRITSGEPKRAEKKKWDVPVQVSLPIRHLMLDPIGDQMVGSVEIYLGVRDDRGRENRPRKMLHEVRVPAAAMADGRGFRYGVNLELRCRGRDQVVAVAVRDRRSGRISFTRADLDLR
jgi:VWFA-related protein